MDAEAITVRVPQWDAGSLEIVCGVANAGGGYVLVPTSRKDYS